MRRHDHPWRFPVTLVDSNLNSEKLTFWPRHTPISWGKDSMVKYCSPGALLWQKSSSIHVWDSAHSKRHNECSNIQEKQDFLGRGLRFSIFQVTAKYSCRRITLSTAHLSQAMLYEPWWSQSDRWDAMSIPEAPRSHWWTQISILKNWHVDHVIHRYLEVKIA